MITKQRIRDTKKLKEFYIIHIFQNFFDANEIFSNHLFTDLFVKLNDIPASFILTMHRCLKPNWYNLFDCGSRQQANARNPELLISNFEAFLRVALNISKSSLECMNECMNAF